MTQSPTLLPHLPPTLHRQPPAQQACFAVGVCATTPLPWLAELLAALQQLCPYPVSLAAVHAQHAAPTQLPAGIQPLCLDDPAHAVPISHTEALLLPHTLLAWGPTFTELAVPVLVHHASPAIHTTAEPEQPIPALVAHQATPAQLASLLVQLATHPPTRRRALDAQLPWLPAMAAGQGGAGQGAAPSAPGTWQVQGVFDSSYSLAIVNRHLASALHQAGQVVSLLTFEQGTNPQPNFSGLEDPNLVQALWQRASQPQPPAVALRNAWPPTVRAMRGHRRVLANYAWEETGFPAEFVAPFNHTLDLITTVSEQTARILQDAGVHVPIAVVGNGVDQLLSVAPEPLPVELLPGHRFLHISSCFPRKGVDVLLAAYGQAFRAWHPVCLVIKTFPNPHNTVASQLAALRQQDPAFPAVQLIQDDWTPGQLTALYQACHTFVLPSRGEGFGLPAAEAMLHELPVIATGWGGHTDFCTPDTAWLIDHTLQPAQSHLSQPGSLWAEPSIKHLAHLLATVHAMGPQQTAQRTRLARHTVLQQYTWAQVAQRTQAALAAVNAMPAPQPSPRVGWVGTWGSRCGIAAYSSHLLGAWAPGQVHIYAPSTEQPITPDAPWVHRTWQQGAGNLQATVQAALAHGVQVLVIQHHWGFYGNAALALALSELKQAGVRVVLEFHNTRSAPPDLHHPQHLQALSTAARLVVHTAADMALLHQWGLGAQALLLPLAVYSVPAPTPQQVQAKAQQLRLQGKRVLATYGFLMPHKGLLQMVQAMPALLQQHPQAHLLMVNAWYSAGASDSELARLQQHINQLGLQAHVTLLTDYLPEADSLALLHQAEGVVFPYQNTEESSSAAVRMALSAGRPVAATPLPIFADVAPAVFSLPGTQPEQLAQGLGQWLHTLADSAQAAQRTRTLAAQLSAPMLSARLKGLLCAICNTP